MGRLDLLPRPRRGGSYSRRVRRSYRARRRAYAGQACIGRVPFGIPPLVLVAAAVSVLIIAVAAIGADRWVAAGAVADSSAAAPNPNCTLIVPANPLSSQGLATPYQLTATDPAAGPCNEANANQTAFVQGAVIDPATGKISVYDPLVVDAGTQPAQPPVVPTLPRGAVVALWFGYNGAVLSLAGADQLGAGQPRTGQQSASTAATGVENAVQARPLRIGEGQASTAASASASPSAPATSAAPSATSGSPSASASPGDSAPASTSVSPSTPVSPSTSSSPVTSASPSASATAPASAATTAPSAPSTTPAAPSLADGPAASGTPDPILHQAKCIAGQVIGGHFTSFSQVGACNAHAFFNAANYAIAAGKLHVPNPGTAKDGLPCPTTRSFALIDQDQSDNVTTQYLANAAGQTAQDTTANKQAVAGAMALFNGSDNGLLDFFVDPALGCVPWTAPDLANGGTPATALPLDELQAARWAGNVRNSGPAALVPRNDPMTVDANGNSSKAKTDTYRSIMDMPALPAGQSPAAYCSDMEKIQGKRVQQDVNLLLGAPSPAPATGNNLFTFLAARLQASFMNLNCGSLGLQNGVSTSADANGVAVAACFQQQVAPLTPGKGNPTAGMTRCPPNASQIPTTSPSPTGSQSPIGSRGPTASGTATPQPTGTTPSSSSAPATAPATASGSASGQPTTGSQRSSAPATGAPSTGTSPAGAPSAGTPTGASPVASPPATASAPTTGSVPATASVPAAQPTVPAAQPVALATVGTTGRGGHDSGIPYRGWPRDGSGFTWPGLGPHWARPNPRRTWAQAIVGGLWSGVLTVL